MANPRSTDRGIGGEVAMNPVEMSPVEQAAERVSRRQLEKFEERRGQLAEAALKTLSELGYARTSLREIAQNSEFSHGVLHYYFTDKLDLIIHCVRQYKTRCVTRYDDIVGSATTGEELRRGFAAVMVRTMVEDAALHRLWYDLRSQALFDESFRADVADIDRSLEQMIWRVVGRLAELTGVAPSLPSSVGYAMLDGLFQQGLLKQLSGDADAAAQLSAGVLTVIQCIVPGSAPTPSSGG
jgi:AcrR family transcriptional regulator